MKAKRGWNQQGEGTDEYGFTALPGGYRNSNGHFDNVDNNGRWWTATEDSDGYAYNRYIYNGDNVIELNNDKNIGLSVRCIAD